mgnify:CR=1 FL=1
MLATVRRVPHSESKDFWRIVDLAGPRFSMLTNGGPRRPGQRRPSRSNYMHALCSATEDTVRKAMAACAEKDGKPRRTQ